MVSGLTACTAANTLNPAQAQTNAAAAWQAPQHVVWEIDWPAAPLGGGVVAETWRAGPRYRYEILEAAAPALPGEVLVSDGHWVWRYNRFAVNSPPPLPSPTERGVSLSPVTDAFALIDHLLAVSPQSATIEPAQLLPGPATKITLIYANGDTLTLWRDDKTGLPAQVVLAAGPGSAVRLAARNLDLLNNPPEELFGVVR